MNQEPIYPAPEPLPKAGPRPFKELPPLWLKVFEMNEFFFTRELPRASGNNVALTLVIVGAVTGVFVGLISALQMAGEGVGGAAGGLCGGLFGGVIGAFAGFYITAGLVFLGARIFGGKGTFGGQTYLQSLYIMPVSVAGALTGLISAFGSLVGDMQTCFSVVGGLASLAVSIFGMVLSVRAVKVAHDLPTGKAIGAVVLFPSILLVIPICLIAVLLLLGGPINEIFETIVESL
jgi:hypothetical protein